MSRIDIEDRYRDWWLGKRCDTDRGVKEYKLVINVIYHSQPSGFYGMVELVFEDGTARLVGGGRTRYGGEAFRPRRCDVEVA